MTPQAFISHWHGKAITERQGAQSHFIDLCDMLGVERPRDPENYCFERGAKTTDGQGWADVWKRGCFGWEYKGPGKDLNAALKQLMNYALALDNPPLLVVCDLSTIEIHTHFTGYASAVHIIRLEDIGQPDNLKKLRALFENPNFFRPDKTTFHVTEQAAARMGEIAQRLTERGNDPHMVAHFLIQCVFCMFAEDAGLLPLKLFETVMDKSNPDGTKAKKRLTSLFEAMQGGGGFGADDIPWFNGGLFKTIDVPDMQTADVVALLEAAKMDWSDVEPAILGTLFERGLNPDMRSQLGAHYTDPATIMKLIHPVVELPLQAEWDPIKTSIADKMQKYEAGGRGSQVAFNDARVIFITFLERLKAFRVLDPACGSGNFLYLSLKSLKDIEHRVRLEAETLGLQRELDIGVSPANVLGIELNPYAAELARVTVWIGDIQWMIAHGYRYRDNPILAPLDHIENRDAVLIFDDGGDPEAGALVGEPEWPEVEAIVGNPPFLGDKKMLKELGDDYVWALRHEYDGRVPGGADFVTYWFEKARAQIELGKAKRAGLVATNSIRGGASRKVLERITESGRIYEAWSDEPWVNAGASVRVSLICFGISQSGAALDGQSVAAIHADLTAGGGLDLTKAKQLPANKAKAFQGSVKVGDFDIPGQVAREWLQLPNPHGRPNADVLRPLSNAKDLTSRSRDSWLVDFAKMPCVDAAMFERPFSHVVEHVKPVRLENRDKSRRENWWLHGRTGDDLRAAVFGLRRVLVTPRVAKHRFFVWTHPRVYCDDATVIIACADDPTFGILSSRFHETWSLRLGTSLEDRPRYTPTTCFDTFPFPAGLTPDIKKFPETSVVQRIADAAIRLSELRENWLNPPEWTERVPEVVPGYPDRVIAKAGHEADLKKRTLTNLYNARPAWLDNIHKELDVAVAAAYGWTDYIPDMSDEEILRRLLTLNLERSVGG